MDLESTLLLMNNAENNILQGLSVSDCMSDVTPHFILLNDPVMTVNDSSSLLLRDANQTDATNKKNEFQNASLLSSFNFVSEVPNAPSQETFPSASVEVLSDKSSPVLGVEESFNCSPAPESDLKLKKASRVRKKAIGSGRLKATKARNSPSTRINAEKRKNETASSGETTESLVPSNRSLPIISDSAGEKIIRTGIITKESPNDPPTLSVPDEESVISVTTNGRSKRRLTQEELKEIGLLLEKRKTFRRNCNVKKVICRVLYPEDIDEPKPAKQLKKPRKKSQPIRKSRGIPAPQNASNDAPNLLVTRSGRVSKRPRNFNRVLKILLNQNRGNDFSDYMKEERLEEKKTVTVVQDKSNQESASLSNDQLMKGLDRVRQVKRTFIKCPTCNKNYNLTLMWRHMNKYPWHVDTDTYNQIQADYSFSQARQKRQQSKLPSRTQRISQVKKLIRYCKKDDLIASVGPRFASSVSLWQFLLMKLKHGRNASSLDLIQMFLRELKETAYEAADLTSKLLMRCSQGGKPDKIVHVEDDSLSKVLGVEKGLYQVNEREFQKLFSPPMMSFPEEPELDRSDNSELLHDMMLLDKSTMDTVDQLVNERLKSLAPGPDDLIVPPEAAPASSHHPLHHHMSHDDDLMSNLLMTAVGDVVPSSCEDISATADDLLKSLETLGTPALDFMALSNEYNPVR